MSFFDITLPLTAETIVWFGDPALKIQRTHSVDKGDGFCFNHITLGNHCGTHIDFPAHIISCGNSSSDYDLESLIGTGLIIEAPDEVKTIDKKIVQQAPILANDIVFFKTSNSELYSKNKFSKKYVYIEVEAAEELVKRGVKIVGIDYLSPDSYENKNLPVHHILLSNEILIVEGLYLKNITTGRYTLYIIPLNIPNMDGLPVRVFIEDKPEVLLNTDFHKL